MVNFPTWIPDCDSCSPVLLDLFLLKLVYVQQWVSCHWKLLIMIMLLSWFPLTFNQIHGEIFYFTAKLMTILVLTGMAILIIWEMFHGRICLSWVLLMLIMWVGSGWNWYVYPSPKVSTLTHLHGFLLLVLLPWFIEITFFLCANRINLLSLK